MARSVSDIHFEVRYKRLKCQSHTCQAQTDYTDSIGPNFPAEYKTGGAATPVKPAGSAFNLLAEKGTTAEVQVAPNCPCRDLDLMELVEEEDSRGCSCSTLFVLRS
jgi:hypothetical protein